MVGVGNTAEVFDYGDDKVCKLFYEGYPKEAVEREYRNAKEVERLGFSVPKVFKLVESEGRIGIVYEKIVGKSMLECIFENPGEADAYLEQFVRLQKEWLSCAPEQSASVFSYKVYLHMLIKGAGQEVETSLYDEINALPEGDTLLHGDFHPGNIMITAEQRYVVIDFMNVCHGPALYDIVRTYLLLKEKDETFGRAYLAMMEVSEGTITVFCSVLEKCRRYEIYGK
ncbi:MAG: phosphotransferase [Lachnospiraceae bacterium]|nr:phosphotransferase [Lachnospiraceae bacterium]